MNIDLYTYGDTLAAQDISQILNESGDKNLANSVSRFFQLYFGTMNKLRQFDARDHKVFHLEMLLYKDFKDKLNSKTNWPKEIVSRCRSVICAEHRQFLRNEK